MLRSSISAPLGITLALACGACGAFPNDKAHETVAQRNVQERAGFDFGCKNPKIQRLGDVARLGQQMTRMNFGVICDGQRGSYTVTCVSNWGDISCSPELNSASKPTASE